MKLSGKSAGIIKFILSALLLMEPSPPKNKSQMPFQEPLAPYVSWNKVEAKGPGLRLNPGSNSNVNPCIRET